MQRCLEKDTKKRLRDIGDARVEIEQIIQSPGEDIDADIAVHQSRTWRRRSVAAIGGGAGLHCRGRLTVCCRFHAVSAAPATVASSRIR